MKVVEDDSNIAKPLFSFFYGGRKIETFGSYSVIDGKICDTHRYFVKNGKLIVIDQELNPSPAGIFIHYDSGESYIVVLCNDGKIVSLGTIDELAVLQDFTNSGIYSLAENITNDSTTLLFEYDDGGIAAYNCITGELLYRIEGRSKPGIVSFVKGFLSNLIGKTDRNNSSATAAQNIISALQTSGKTMSELIDSGIAEGLTTGSFGDASSDTAGIKGDVTGKSGTTDESGFKAGPLSNSSFSGNASGKGNKDQIKKNISKEHELSIHEQQVLEEILELLANGEIDAEEAIKRIRDSIPGISEDDLRRIKTEIDSISIAVDTNGNVIKQNVNAGASGKHGEGNVREDGSGEKESGTGEPGDGADEFGEGDEEEKEEFIKQSINEDYISIYNAKEGKYEIFATSDLLSNPQGAQSELAKLDDKTKLETINRLLSVDTHDRSTRRGALLYLGIAVAIIVIMIVMLFTGKKKNDRKENKKQKTDKNGIT